MQTKLHCSKASAMVGMKFIGLSCDITWGCLVCIIRCNGTGVTFVQCYQQCVLR